MVRQASGSFLGGAEPPPLSNEPKAKLDTSLGFISCPRSGWVNCPIFSARVICDRSPATRC